jgi:hypothetical protein
MSMNFGLKKPLLGFSFMNGGIFNPPPIFAVLG